MLPLHYSVMLMYKYGFPILHHITLFNTPLMYCFGLTNYKISRFVYRTTTLHICSRYGNRNRVARMKILSPNR